METKRSVQICDQEPPARRFSKIDIIAIITILGAFCYYAFFISYGTGYNDESFYYTIAQRLLNGDRLLVDEWFVSQLSSVLEIIPYKIAVWFCGGTEGIILFLRYFYLLSRIPIACLMWIMLRRYKLWGLFGELTYLLFIDFDAMTFSYYLMAIDGMIVVSFLFFLSKKRSPPKLAFIGFVFACVVLAEPLSVLIYVFYTVSVIVSVSINKKKPDGNDSEFLAAKTWFYVTLGCVFCAVLFFIFLFINSNPRLMIQTIPEIMKDPYYNLLRDTNGNPRFISKLLSIISFFRGPITVLFVLFAVIVFLVMRDGKTRKNKTLFRSVCFLIGCILSVVMLIRFISAYQLNKTIAWSFFAPYQFMAIVFYLLCSQRDRASFWLLVAGLLFSFSIDSSSQVMIGFGGCLCQISFWISFGKLTEELYTTFSKGKARKNKHKGSSVLHIGASIAVILCVVLWQATFIRTELSCPVIESSTKPAGLLSLDTVIQNGPLKGLKTKKHISQTVSLLTEDIDHIKANRSGPLFIFGKSSFLYLYADIPYACNSTWFEYGLWEHQITYWKMLPEHIPQSIYIPFYDLSDYSGTDQLILNDFLSKLDTLFDYGLTNGQAGYILEVNRIKIIEQNDQ